MQGSVLNPIGQNSVWYPDPTTTLPMMLKTKQVIHATLEFNGTTVMNRLPLRFWGYKDMSLRILIQSHHDLMLQ